MPSYGTSVINKSSKKYTPKAPARRNRQEPQSQSSSASQPVPSKPAQRDEHQAVVVPDSQSTTAGTAAAHVTIQRDLPSSSTTASTTDLNDTATAAQISSSISQASLPPRSTRSVDRSTPGSRKRQRVEDEPGHIPQTRSTATSLSQVGLPTPEPTQTEPAKSANDESREVRDGGTAQEAAPQSIRQRVAARARARKQARQVAEGRAAQHITQQITNASAIRGAGNDSGTHSGQSSAVAQTHPSSVNTRNTRSSEQGGTAHGSNGLLPQKGVSQEQDSVTQTEPSAKRKRGRPKKSATSSRAAESLSSQTTMSSGDILSSRQAVDIDDGETDVIENVEDGDHNEDHGATRSSEPQPKRRRKPAGSRKHGSSADTEHHKIDAGALSMNDLSKDSRRGKTSGLEARMQNVDWGKVIAQRKAAEREALERAAAAQEAQQHGNTTTAPDGDADPDYPAVQGDGDAVNDRLDRAEAESSRYTGPRLKLVDGQMVVDESTRTVERYAENPEIDATTGAAFEEIEEDDITRRINRQSWLHASRRDPLERRVSNKSDPWTESQTNSFYDALRMFGTDFYIISRMFLGKTRRHIKLKFNREERANPDRVQAALLGGNVPMDMKVYEQRTGKAEGYYKDPEILKRELAEADEQQRAEIEKQKEEEREAAKKKMEAARERQEAAKRGRRGRRKDVDMTAGTAENGNGDAMQGVEDRGAVAT